MYKILIVEDDEIIADSIKKYLESWSYEIQTIRDFNAVDREFEEFNPDLVLLDISLPYYNGFFWCEKIRKKSNKPIIFISSATDNMNIVMAITKGADDFISKPFDLSVLLAKVQALLRRTYELQIKNDYYSIWDMKFDPSKSQVEKNGDTIELSKNESMIFKMLLDHKNKIVSREDLMVYLWDTDEFVDDNTLTVNINRLRKKLEQIGVKDLIQTRKGIGYTIVGDD